MTTAVLHHIPIEQLHESPLNPRKRFNTENLAELAESLRTHGVITPLRARPTKNGKAPAFELAAGHRRLRAAKLAGLAEVPVVVSDLDDAAFLEVLTIENLQREDLHPLEEAQSFADLMKHAGYDVAKIAGRVHRSKDYVYDRLTLLQLTKPAQKLFLEGRFTVGHAIILARLPEPAQKRAIEPDNNGNGYRVAGLFEADGGLLDELEDPKDKYATLKPVSTGEFQNWVNDNVRFRPEDDPHISQLFPETAQVLAQAVEVEEKLVKITYDGFVRPEAKEEGERTYGPQSWARADGKPDAARYGADGRKPSKTCEYSVTGVVVVGEDRGKAFKVCINKLKCKTHWAEQAKRAEEKKRGHIEDVAKGVGAEERRKKDEELAKAEAAKQKALDEALAKAAPALFSAFVAELKHAPTDSKSKLVAYLLDHYGVKYRLKEIQKHISIGTTAADVLRYLAFALFTEDSNPEYEPEGFVDDVKRSFGVNLQPVLDKHLPKEEKAAKPAKKKAKAKR